VKNGELQKRLDGIFVPMFTPFTFDGSTVNEKQLRENVQYLISSGIRLLNPAGTTGEFWTLSPKEHHRVLRVVIEEARAQDPDVIVIAGASCQSLTLTLDMVRFAGSCGASLVQVTPPYYLPCSDDDLVAYYRAISNSSDIGIMLYEIPPATGVTLRGRVLERICDECPRVIALKTAAAATAPREFERLVRQHKDRLSIFSATGAYYSPFTYLTGVAGITDTLSNVAPDFGLNLHRLARADRWQEMNQIYQEAFDVLEIELLYGKLGLKEIGNYCGLNVGPTRFPMVDTLSESAREDIQRRLFEWRFTRDRVGSSRSLAQPAAAMALD
jgi:4-hydroxy-tetrahydrodipicolinate synthase